MEDKSEIHIRLWDIVVIVVYFVFVLTVGIWSSRKSRKGSVSGYFLASRNMHWLPVGASLFASNIGSGHFIGLAGSGAAAGVGVAGFEIVAVFTLMVLGWIFVPVYMSSGVYTMPEYLKHRYGGERIRIYLSFLALLLYILSKISADLYAGALFIQLALNKNSPEWLYISIGILLAMAAVFTIAGGLTAVIWTDFLQTILMIIGALILMIISFQEVGGFQELINKFPYAIPQLRPSNNTCGIPPEDYMSLLRSPHPGVSDLPWTGVTFGLATTTIWYWCADQVIVQRTLAAKNMSHAKGGCILAAYLKHLPLWLLIMPGMAARILFPDRVGCTDPEECQKICGSPGGCTNIAYPELVIKLLPTGLAGLMLAVMMAALMSSLTSIFNSASTIFTMDVWKRIRKDPKDVELVIVGRVFVVILVAISVLWIPVIQNVGNSRLFDYIQGISSVLAPPISAVYLLAVFWPRANEKGAFSALMIGLTIGVIRWAMLFSYSGPSCANDLLDDRPELVRIIVGNVHFLHFSPILFLISVLIIVSVSLMTEPIPEECLYRLTFWSRHSRHIRISIEDFKKKKLRSTSTNNIQKETLEIQNSATTSKFGEKSAEDDPSEAARLLTESPKLSFWTNLNAIFVMSLTVFVWAFFH